VRVVCDGRQECDLIQKGFCLPRRCERTCKGNNAKKEFADQGKRDTHNEMPVKKSEREKEILSRLGMALTLFFSLITTSRHSSLSQSHSRHPTDGAKNEQLERTDGAGRAGVLFFGENGFSSPFCWGTTWFPSAQPVFGKWFYSLPHCWKGKQNTGGREQGDVTPSVTPTGSKRETKIWYAIHTQSLALVSELVLSVSFMLFHLSVRLSSRAVIRPHFRPLSPVQPDDKVIGDGIVARARPPLGVKMQCTQSGRLVNTTLVTGQKNLTSLVLVTKEGCNLKEKSPSGLIICPCIRLCHPQDSGRLRKTQSTNKGREI